MNEERREIRVLLVGDARSGKSSLITHLIKDSFVDQVQHVSLTRTMIFVWFYAGFRLGRGDTGENLSDSKIRLG